MRIFIFSLLFLISLLVAHLSLANCDTSLEKRKRIGVLDTGIQPHILNKKYMCKDMPFYDLFGDGLDYHGHGTNIVGLIGERIDSSKYCITSYNLSKNSGLVSSNFLLYKMSKHNLVGLNLSLASKGYDGVEEKFLNDLSEQGVKIFIAAGNNKQNLNMNCDVYPACHKILIKSIIIVGSKDRGYSNFGDIVDIELDGTKKGSPEMSGTSQATAIATGKYFSR